MTHAAAAAAAALGVALLAAGCGRAPPRRAAPPPDLGGYAGAAACLRCHEDEGRDWSTSAHGKHGTFAARPQGGADLAVGSRWMQAYLVRTPAGLHEIAPTCLDLRDGSWRRVSDVLFEISGAGREGARPRGAAAKERPTTDGRTFETDCAGCHASQPRNVLDEDEGLVEPRRTDVSINCEACHGPGRAHAESWARLERPVPMARLDRLTPRESTALCARCHGGPPTAGDFGPADAADYLPDLRDLGGTFADGRAAGQVYQIGAFARSPCASEGGLTCAGCHDAHGPGLHTTTGSDGLCVSCHAEHAGRAHTHHDPARDGARCVECHMPRLLDGLVGHQRDHTIGVPLPQVASSPDACTACHAGRDKAWASRAWVERWGDPPRETIEAVHALAEAREGRLDRAALERALLHPDPYLRANAGLHLGDAARLRGDARPEVRLVAVAAAHAGAGSVPDLEALARDPEPRVRAAAMLGLAQRGRAPGPGDHGTFLRAARQQGGAPMLHAVLAQLEAGVGAHGEASEHALAGWLLEPRDAAGAEHAARAALDLGREERAWAILRAAARLAPDPQARARLHDLARRASARRSQRGRP